MNLVSLVQKGTVNVFESQATPSKGNVTLLMFLNKEIRCAWCIWSLTCMNIDSVDVFRTEKASETIE